MLNPIGSKLTLPGEHLPESIGDLEMEDEIVTVVLRLFEEGMCVIQRPNGQLLEVSDDVLWSLDNDPVANYELDKKLGLAR